MKNKIFTYNYDGTMLMVQQPKIEKLPSQAYVVKYILLFAHMKFIILIIAILLVKQIKNQYRKKEAEMEEFLQ